MEELKKQQLEALEVAEVYCEKLITGIQNIVNELTGERLSDTDEFLKQIINGINWTIEVYNGTKDLFNAETELIDKESVNKSIIELDNAIKMNNDLKIANNLNEILIFIKKFKVAARAICS